jgi:pyridoxal phosphate enzyme (YggS family)
MSMKVAEREFIRDNLDQVTSEIQQAASSVEREPSSVRLVVVTKGHPINAVQEAIAAGVRILGENYAEEAIEKKIALHDESDLEWHMIGHVQSRKASLICEYFDYLHSLDSLKLAKRLDRYASEMGRKLPVLLECNVSGEESKFGFSAWREERWAELKTEISAILALAHLQVLGLMTMAPFFDEPEPARPYFHRLHRLRDYLKEEFPKYEWKELSMGMSGDFQVAIQEGATLVRIGTAIMGPRP